MYFLSNVTCGLSHVDFWSRTNTCLTLGDMPWLVSLSDFRVLQFPPRFMFARLTAWRSINKHVWLKWWSQGECLTPAWHSTHAFLPSSLPCCCCCCWGDGPIRAPPENPKRSQVSVTRLDRGGSTHRSENHVAPIAPVAVLEEKRERKTSRCLNVSTD